MAITSLLTLACNGPIRRISNLKGSRRLFCLHHVTSSSEHQFVFGKLAKLKSRSTRPLISARVVSSAATAAKPKVERSEQKPIKLVSKREQISEIVQWEEHKEPNATQLIKHWLSLAKFRLTSLVVMTTMAGFWMGCGQFEPALLAATVVGTALTSSSAASLNQYLEIPFDSQMVRTRNRPLVLGQLTPLHAVAFSAVTGTAGLSLLWAMVNPLTTILGAVNLILYSAIYTPMKRSNIANTWVGSVVGSIPPVMGYTAATGLIDPCGLVLGGILYSWQFPHFKALSWNLRHDYARAGYRMTSVTNPDLCLRTALRHSVLVAAYCALACAPQVGLTSWYFFMDSAPFNAYLIYLSYKFRTEPTAANSRKLFRFSLVHLPAIILLMLIAKKTRNNEKNNETVLVASEINNAIR